MARYVDGFVLPVSKRKIGAYRKMARLGARIWKDCGALEYFECVGDDLKVAPGCGLPFPKGIRLRAGETVVLAWIVYKSKAHRNAVNARVMKDPRMNNFDPKSMPFDVRRMMYGGFQVLVEA